MDELSVLINEKFFLAGQTEEGEKHFYTYLPETWSSLQRLDWGSSWRPRSWWCHELPGVGRPWRRDHSCHWRCPFSWVCCTPPRWHWGHLWCHHSGLCNGSFQVLVQSQTLTWHLQTCSWMPWWCHNPQDTSQSLWTLTYEQDSKPQESGQRTEISADQSRSVLMFCVFVNESNIDTQDVQGIMTTHSDQSL